MARVILSYDHDGTKWTVPITAWKMSALLNTIVNDTEHEEDVVVDIPFADTSLHEALRVHRTLNDMITITREYENFGATTNNPNDLWNAYCNIRGCAHRILNCADVKLYKFLTPVIEPYTLSKNIIHSVMENRFTHPFYYYVHRYNLFCKYDSQRPYWQFTLECMLMEKDEYISVCKKYKERPIYQKYMILMKSSSRYTSYDLLNILVQNPKFDIQRVWYIYECKDKRFPNGFMEKICKIVEEKGTPETLKWLTDTFPA